MAKAEAQQEDPAALAARRVIEQQREREKRARERAALGGLWSRRDVFGRFGWSIFGAFSLVSLLAALRSAFPRVLFQRSEEHTSELQSRFDLVCRLLLEKKKRWAHARHLPTRSA